MEGGVDAFLTYRYMDGIMATERGTKMRKNTFVLPEEAARELAVYAASHFMSLSEVIHQALFQVGVVKSPRQPSDGRKKAR